MFKQTVEKRVNTMKERDKRRFLTKVSKKIDSKKVFFGKETMRQKPQGKVVKGESNFFLGRALGFKYK